MDWVTLPIQKSTRVEPHLSQPQCSEQNQKLVPVITNVKKSVSLIAIGTVLLLISFTLLCFCLWIVSMDREKYGDYLHGTFYTIFSSLYHLAPSILALIGGRDVARRRYLIGVCVGLTILGVTIFTTFALLLNRLSLTHFNNYCHKRCSVDKLDQSLKYQCTTRCNYTRNFYLVKMLGLFFQVILDLFISIVGCINICRRCHAKSKIASSS